MIDMITAEVLETKVREIATANPDYVYDYSIIGRCYYTKPNGGCLIGQALVALEPELLPVLQELDERGCPQVNRLPLKMPLALNITRWIVDVQQSQDDGRPWSKCIEFADKLRKDYND
jgi:hypothetical protein